MKLKYGIYYAYWEKEWDADYRYYVKKVARLGFDALEIGCSALPDYTDAAVRELRQCAKDEGIELTGGYGPRPIHNVGSSDEKIREGAFEWYKRCFDKMAQLDMHVLGGALYYYWPVDFHTVGPKEEEWKRAVEGMQRLAPLAEACGITLGMEVINRYESYLINTCDECGQFVREVGAPNVKVMLDTYHMNIEEDDLGGAIRHAGHLLGHFHVGECNRKVPGMGRIPWREIGTALRDINYNGYVVMEPFVRMGGTVGRNIGVWRDISQGAGEENLDRDARESCRFLHYVFED